MIAKSKLKKPIVLIIILLIVLSAGCAQKRTSEIRVEQGTINLEHWDFESQGTVQLDGDWEFNWMKLLKPNDFNHLNKTPEYLRVPSTWGSSTKEDISYKGYATYRMTMHLGSQNQDVLGIRLNPVYTAYKLWINGMLVAEVGKVAHNQEEFSPKLVTKTLFFNPKPETELVIQVANMEYSRAGFLKSMELGTQAQLLKERETRLAAELFSTGAIIIMALYHFGLYMLRRKKLSTLYFGVFCLLVGTRTILVGETFFGYLAPGISLNAELHIHALILYLAPIFFLLFFDSLFPDEIDVRFIKIFSATALTGLVLSLVMGTKYYGLILYIFEIVLVLVIGYLLWILYKILRHQREGSITALAGSLILFACTLNDILVDYELIHTGYVLSFGLFMFIFSQSFLLSKTISKAFTKVEFLSEQLELQNQTLEQNVRERTIDLVKANQQLQAEIAERKQAEEKIRHMAYHDYLTGLPNRKYFMERLSEEISRAKRNNELLSVMFMDLNNFKSANDTYGHETGDLLLCSAAKRIKGVLRPSDIVSRLGGDEFIILLIELTEEGSADIVARKIDKAFKRPVFIKGNKLTIEASIGISYYPRDGSNAEELIKKADCAMYIEKKQSKESDKISV